MPQRFYGSSIFIDLLIRLSLCLLTFILLNVCSGPEVEARRPEPEIYIPKNRYDNVPSLSNIPTCQGEKFSPPEKKSSSQGTAFSIAPGWWATARHVTSGCHTVILAPFSRLPLDQKKVVQINGQNKPLYGLESSFTRENNLTDTALIKSNIRRTSLPLASSSTLPNPGEQAFAHGYADGNPSHVDLMWLGSNTERTPDNPRGCRVEKEQRDDLWAINGYFPEHLQALGGISGGPVLLTASGDVVGILAASTHNLRRGRVYSSSLASLYTLIHQEKLTNTRHISPNTVISPRTTSREQRHNQQVIRVFCSADPIEEN